MSKRFWLFSAIVLSFLLPTYSFADQYTIADDSLAIAIEIHPGWNLVPNFMQGDPGMQGFIYDINENIKTLHYTNEDINSKSLARYRICDTPSQEPSMISDSYFLDPQTKQYIIFANMYCQQRDLPEDDLAKWDAYIERVSAQAKIPGTDLSPLIINLMWSAHWIYSDDSANVLIFNVKPDQFAEISTMGGVPLYDGWNFLAISPDMIGWQLSSLPGTCTVTKMAQFLSGSQQWIVLGPSYLAQSIGTDDIGAVMAIKVAGDCNIVEEPPRVPPQIPQ